MSANELRGQVRQAFMPPASRAHLAFDSDPQLALWATDIIAGYAG
jgi:hypothetical protein